MTPDEVRDNFDRNPIEGGDKLPARTATKETAAPAKDDPEPAPGPKRKKD